MKLPTELSRTLMSRSSVLPVRAKCRVLRRNMPDADDRDRSVRLFEPLEAIRQLRPAAASVRQLADGQQFAGHRVEGGHDLTAGSSTSFAL